jgi:cbb3-type cytochrome oxidase maturation protein
MQVIVVLLLASVVVAAGFLIAFLWAVRSEQFDDLETPAVRMLFDSPGAANQNENKDSSIKAEK